VKASIPVGRTLLVRGLRGSSEWLGSPKEGQAAPEMDVLLLVKASAVTQ
jgi:hypothetical protein